MPNRLTRAAIAAVVAAVLLSGSGTTLAGWADAEHRDQAVLSAGRLAVEPVAASTAVLRPGTSQPLPADTAIVPGDVVRVTSTVSVSARGTLLTGTLSLDLGALGGLGGPTVSATTALPAAGANRWTVTPDDDGAQVTAVIDLAVPATTDGRPPAADRSNWWGEQLQHTTLDAGAVRWTLTQEMP
ncbi:alternate-type signal peptide domain-containing protein [Georgenia sp. H159]|uniref:alternate-type signal peptide domain-containing protein n=1 Tax=Georgenia sp. H159 TaxID=3076115 RepID=UPI002D77BBBC|nr:alternate-type signal peptide domain-containing protein [Georgenia sp. H159]